MIMNHKTTASKKTAVAIKKAPKNNNKQLDFAREYCVDGNGKQAAIRAGYKPGGAEPTASRLLRNAKVQAEIARIKKEKEEKLIVNANWVLLEQKNVYDAAIRAGDLSNANRALENIGKHNSVRAFTESNNNQGAGQLNVEINIIGVSPRPEIRLADPREVNSTETIQKALQGPDRRPRRE